MSDYDSGIDSIEEVDEDYEVLHNCYSSIR